MTPRKIFIRFCKNIESFVMKSINVQGGFLFCAGWNFPKLVSMTSCLLERWEYGSWELFFLCSPDCPKHPRNSFPFYKFFYTTISCRISDSFLASVLDSRLSISYPLKWKFEWKKLKMSSNLTLCCMLLSFFYVVNYMDSCLDVTISMPEVRALRYSTSVFVLAVGSWSTCFISSCDKHNSC